MLARTNFCLFLTVLTVIHCLAIPPSADEPTTTLSTNSTNNAAPSHSQVLVIGAGPSGVAAASRLMENGVLDVTILEAEDRLGGRINTVQFGDDVVDLGAQWVQGARGNVVYDLANPLGLLEENTTTSIDNMRYLQRNGQLPDHDLLNKLLNISVAIPEETVQMLTYSGSFGQYFQERFSEEISNPGNNINADPALVDAFKYWMEKTIAFSDGADSWYNVSAKGMNQTWECEGDQTINWINNGFYSVINLLTKRYPNPDQELPVRNNTRLRTEVKTIHWGPNAVVTPAGKRAVVVETTDGSRYTADKVLVTVSLGVLKEKAQTMFHPPLPERKTNAIQHFGFGQVDKLFLHFNETWWPANITGLTFIATDEDREQFNRLYPQYSEKGEWVSSLTGFYRLPRQPKRVLFDWIVGEPARNMEKYSDEEVKAACLIWLEMFLGHRVPSPVSFTRSKWYSNPHFRGSYTHRSMDSEKFDAQPAHLAEPLLGQDGTPEVFFAGEATNDHHFGYVHGAIETGWREADRILALLGKKSHSH